MGCNQSKQDDIKADNEQRQRNPTTPQPTSGGSQATPSRSIASSSVNNDQSGMMLGVSYSDQRDNEHGYFKDIVERTALNFIDVSVTGLQEKEAAEGNGKDFGITTLDAREFDSKIYGLPNHSDSQPIRTSLTNPTPKQLLDMATNTNHAIVSGLKAMHVADVGEIVINFPEISM